MSQQSAPPPQRPRPGSVQPLRALLVVMVGIVVAAYVLARTTTPAVRVAAAHPKSTTSAVANTTTTTGNAATTTTTVPTTTTSTTLPPASVTVLVLNGWTTYHAASYFQHQLAAKGYDTRAPENALSSTNKTSLVFFTSPTYRSNALAIGGALGLPSADVVAPTSANDAPVPSVDLSSADIILLVGADISARVPPNYNG
jgi:hypothetical protein